MQRPGRLNSFLGNSQSPDILIVLLHGMGGDGTRWISTATFLATQLPTALFMMPTAPKYSVQLHGVERPSWFNRCHEQQDSQVMEAALHVETLITSVCVVHGIALDHVVLCGMSQGGVVALATALTAVGKVAGIISISSGLLAARHILPMIRHKDLPVVIFHGSADIIVSLEVAKRTQFELLNSAKMQFVELKVYEGLGHTICQQEMQDVLCRILRFLHL